MQIWCFVEPPVGFSGGGKEDKDLLMEAVIAAYADFEPRKLNFAFLMLHQCLDKNMHRNNTYKLPHKGKETLLLLARQLPMRVEASDAAVDIGSVNCSWIKINGDKIIAG